MVSSMRYGKHASLVYHVRVKLSYLSFLTVDALQKSNNLEIDKNIQVQNKCPSMYPLTSQLFFVSLFFIYRIYFSSKNLRCTQVKLFHSEIIFSFHHALDIIYYLFFGMNAQSTYLKLDFKQL